ncbi:MAG: hypothetical protein JO060_06615 [Candidatus Eremiobacteraeota bacterium]|nr:hypothetical protein [Candidatus Eremiobacteraeota bacterium]
MGSFLIAALAVRYKWRIQRELAVIGPFAYPLAVALFTVVASAPFSVTDALAIMNGVLFGPLWGSVVNGAWNVCAAIVGYLVALRTSQLLDLDRQVARLPGWAKRFRVGSPAFLLTVRLIPGFGGTLATQVAAAWRVPMFLHVWTMSLIAVPICTLLAIFGDRVAVAVHDYWLAHHPHVHMHFPFHRHRPPPLQR